MAKISKEIREKLRATREISEEMKHEYPTIIGELCFVLLPFIIIFFADLSKHELKKLMHTSEWGIAASVLFGLTLFKVVTGLSSNRRKLNHQGIGMISALILVFGLIPSIVLVVIFETSGEITTVMLVMQFILVFLSIVSFLFIGTFGQILVSRSSVTEKGESTN